MAGRNDTYRPRCVGVVFFVEKNETTHSVHVITKYWWKGVGEEEPAKIT